MAEGRMFHVVLMSGPQDGLRLSFTLAPNANELMLTIGRSDSCDIALPHDSQVSRTHARLICTCSEETAVDVYDELSRLSFSLKDAESRNGTYIGERRLRGNEAEPIHPGELFRVGRTWLRIDL